MKKCTKCNKIKPLTEFNKRNASKDGLRYECKECHKNQSLDWQRANPGKRSVHNQKWGKNNKAKKNANWAKYHYAKMQRTPKWLTEGDHIEMNWAYQISRERSETEGLEYNVDHIEPVQGEHVSGLHVPWNLRIITKTENVKKSNKNLSLGLT